MRKNTKVKQTKNWPNMNMYIALHVHVLKVWPIQRQTNKMKSKRIFEGQNKKKNKSFYFSFFVDVKMKVKVLKDSNKGTDQNQTFDLWMLKKENETNLPVE